MVGRPRKPLTAAKTEGRDVMNKRRFSNRGEHDDGGPLGDPPDWIVDTPSCRARTAWRNFEVEIPWLKYRDRTLVGTASRIQGLIIAGQDEVGIQKLNYLRMCLSSMGATPADATKVGAPPKEDPEDDDFNRKGE